MMPVRRLMVTLRHFVWRDRMKPEIFEKYKHLFTSQLMMGPNTIRLLDEMVTRYPLENRSRMMDLGCGTGLSSLYLAQETDAQIFAVDLWIGATDNAARFAAWQVEDRVIPIHADARELPFADKYFDAIVSVDAYHYFGCDDAFFAQKILPLVKAGGQVLIVVPGLKAEYGDDVPPLMQEWAGDEHALFHSCDWWKKTIGAHEDIATVEVVELTSGDLAWQEWFASGHQYSAQDQAFFDRGIGQYLNFVGIAVTKK